MRKYLLILSLFLSGVAYGQYPYLINNNLQVNGWAKMYYAYLDRLQQDTSVLKILGVDANNKTIYLPKSYFTHGAISGGSVTSIGNNQPYHGFKIYGKNPIIDTGVWTFRLTEDLAAVENLTTYGITERLGDSNWITIPDTSWIAIINGHYWGTLTGRSFGSNKALYLRSQNNYAIHAITYGASGTIWADGYGIYNVISGNALGSGVAVSGHSVNGSGVSGSSENSVGGNYTTNHGWTALNAENADSANLSARFHKKVRIDDMPICHTGRSVQIDLSYGDLYQTPDWTFSGGLTTPTDTTVRIDSIWLAHYVDSLVATHVVTGAYCDPDIVHSYKNDTISSGSNIVMSVINSAWVTDYLIDIRAHNGYDFLPAVAMITEQYFTASMPMSGLVDYRISRLNKDLNGTDNVRVFKNVPASSGDGAVFPTSDSTFANDYLVYCQVQGDNGYTYRQEPKSIHPSYFTIDAPFPGVAEYWVSKKTDCTDKSRIFTDSTKTAGTDKVFYLGSFFASNYSVWIRCETSDGYVFYPPAKAINTSYFTADIGVNCTVDYKVFKLTN